MDRERLAAWLESPNHTWRWGDGEDSAHYEGVTTTDEGLRWFRWSHIFADEVGEGEHDALVQTYAAFRKDGPARPLPDGVRDELTTWVDEHRGDA